MARSLSTALLQSRSSMQWIAVQRSRHVNHDVSPDELSTRSIIVDAWLEFEWYDMEFEVVEASDTSLLHSNIVSSC